MKYIKLFEIFNPNEIDETDDIYGCQYIFFRNRSVIHIGVIGTDNLIYIPTLSHNGFNIDSSVFDINEEQKKNIENQLVVISPNDKVPLKDITSKISNYIIIGINIDSDYLKNNADEFQCENKDDMLSFIEKEYIKK
jgi:hypothetical protein